MNILITGATGGLGRNCVEILKSTYNIIATGRNEKIGNKLVDDKVKFISIDLTKDLDKLELALKDIDVVVHCAALTGVKGSLDEYYAINLEATMNILTLAKKSKVSKFIYISSPSVYYKEESIKNIKETQIFSDSNVLYVRSKQMAEEYILKTLDDNFQVVILRPRSIIGQYDQVIVPQILNILKKGLFPLINKGHAMIDVTNVKNIVHAIDCCIKSEQNLNGQVYNISNGEPMMVKDLIKLLGNKSKTKYMPLYLNYSILTIITNLIDKIFIGRNRYKYQLDLLSLDQTLDISKAKKDLGYNPKESIQKGLDDFFKGQYHV